MHRPQDFFPSSIHTLNQAWMHRCRPLMVCGVWEEPTSALWSTSASVPKNSFQTNLIKQRQCPSSSMLWMGPRALQNLPQICNNNLPILENSWSHALTWVATRLTPFPLYWGQLLHYYEISHNPRTLLPLVRTHAWWVSARIGYSTPYEGVRRAPPNF